MPSSFCYTTQESHVTSELHYISVIIWVFYLFIYFSFHTSLKFTSHNKPRRQHINLVCFQAHTLTERAVGGSGESVSSDSESLHCSLMDPTELCSLQNLADCHCPRHAPKSQNKIWHKVRGQRIFEETEDCGGL